ncbi:MAG: DUF3837 family protein [Lachnospiraceae bacterium]|nr:DUF3837 family protein [Lachnospiraceae bacterium]
MIPLLTAQAIERKCSFEHVVLLGNYELCYSLGIISKAAGLPKESAFDNVGVLKDKIIGQIDSYQPAEVTMQRLLRVVKEMDTYTEDYDDQMYELYQMGYNKGII